MVPGQKRGLEGAEFSGIAFARHRLESDEHIAQARL